MIITVRPINTTTAKLGLTDAGYTRYPDCHYAIRVPGDRMSGYKTGLEIQVPNPDYKSETETPTTAKTVLLRTMLERRLGGNIDLSPKSEFWEIHKVKLGEGIHYYDLDIPTDELNYYILKSSRDVADSEIERYKFPDATYVIFDEDADNELARKKSSLKEEAFAELKEMSPDFKKQICRVLGKDMPNSKESFIHQTLFEIIDKEDKGPQRFLEVAKRSKENVRTEALVKEALSCGVLTRKDGRIHKTVAGIVGEPIGTDVDSVVALYAQAKNWDLRQQLEEDVKSKKYHTETGI